MRKERVAGILLTAALVAGTASSAFADEGKVLKLGWNADMQTMDVHKTSSNYCIPLNIFDRMFEIKLNDDGSTELVKSLVDDYTISEDGLVYNFTLRDDVVFSDGTPLTAYDIEYTFTRMLALPESVQTDFACIIAGADPVMEGEADVVEGINVIDDTHLEITLSEPCAGYLYQLATPSCCIFSKANVEEAGDDFGINPEKTIGSGPYVLTEWNANDSLVLEASPTYWGDPVSAERVEIYIYPESATMDMAFQMGDIDILDCDSIDSAIIEATYKTAYADKIVAANRLATTYMALNANVEPLNDVKVRKAIQMAIDRQSILDAVYSGDGSLVDGIYSKGLIGFTEDNQGWLQYDPEGAKALLAEAGYADGFDMEIAADASASTGVMDVLLIISENLKAVGINAEVKSYDEAAWLELRKAGEMTSFVATWTADYNDPDNFIYTFYGNEDKTKLRSLNYADTDVMQRVTDARAIVDDEERLAEYAALEKKIVEEDAAWVPMYTRSHLFVVGDNVEKFVPHWAGYSDFSCVGVTMK